ncbi:hypothetical protein [Brevibacterium aurantiacum]|uniref:hypothetical protein n=1 Tax=Brevibacterium aurantiacum TaxID=273384 RepID=UPI000F6469B6|nr:hypothetical protein [Brevibacterium aurantiacum]AZL10550.1 hypothetical protein CXR26_16010 [Brevibacterium aurantiacum]
MNIYDVPVDDTKFFPVSGDELRRQTLREQNDGHVSRKESVAADHQCQNTQKEDEMSTTNSSKTGTVKHPSWSVPNQMRVFGTDVMHQGTTYSLERANENGDEYSLKATVTQLEEIGHGLTTDPYVNLVVDSAPFGNTVLNLDIAELETLTDWLMGIVEKVQHLKPKH